MAQPGTWQGTPLILLLPPLSDFVFLLCSSAAQTRTEAEHIAEALDTAGFVMRFRDKVYLRPAEIAGMVLQVSHV